MLIYEKLFDDKTGIRIVTVPDEALQKEVVKLILRVSTGPTTVKVVSLVMKDGEKDLSDEFIDAFLQLKIKEIGRQCAKCEKYFLPTSPNQKVCTECKESD
jgi:hypothetical protein